MLVGRSTPATVTSGVPQGSVLRPILFLLYRADLLRLIEGHNLHLHVYADDTQIYCFCFCPPSAISVFQEQMSACLDEVALWIHSNRLQLNTAKTEVLWCATSRRQYQIPQASVRVGEDLITPAASIRDLGIYLDSDTSTSHTSQRLCRTALLIFVGSTAYAAVSPGRRCSPWLSRWFCHDYGSATLVGLPAYQIDRLQSVLNVALGWSTHHGGTTM